VQCGPRRCNAGPDVKRRDALFQEFDLAHAVHSIGAKRPYAQATHRGEVFRARVFSDCHPITAAYNTSIYFINLALPAFMAAARAPVRPNWVRWPLIRWVEFKFLTTMIWKQVALPWREAITDHARKSSQICKKWSVRRMSCTDSKLVTYPEPALTVLGLDGIDVAEPVAVPSPESSGVVHTDGVNAAKKSSIIVLTHKSCENRIKHTS
jgi:hypothetical protein